jgi:hypothetical protein
VPASMAKGFRVAKKAKRGKKAGTCLDCGKSLRERDRKCKRCGKASPLFTPKAARRPYLVKASNVVPMLRKSAGRASCWNGHPPGRRGSRYCTNCGEAYSTTLAEHTEAAYKAADPLGGTYWGQAMMRESDPGQREVLRQMASREPGSRIGDVAFLAKSMGYRDLQDACRREPDRERAQMFWQALVDPTINPGGAA